MCWIISKYIINVKVIGDIKEAMKALDEEYAKLYPSD